MHLEIFVYLLCRFLGENCIYTVQRENSLTIRALPRNWPFGLVIENRSCKDWHAPSFPQADSGCQHCGFQTAPLPKVVMGCCWRNIAITLTKPVLIPEIGRESC